jgi:hypothetical protein
MTDAASAARALIANLERVLNVAETGTVNPAEIARSPTVDGALTDKVG